MTIVGNLPVVQIDALPEISIATYATSHTQIKVGANIFRTWTPTQTGINGQSSNVGDPRGDANVYLLTNWLDFTGMTRVTLSLLAIVGAAGGEGAVTWGVRLIASTGSPPVEPAPFLPGPDKRNMTGNYATAGAFPQVGALTIPSPTVVGVPYPFNKLATCSFQCGSAGAGGTIATGGISPCRLLFISNAGSDPLTNFLTVYASS